MADYNSAYTGAQIDAALALANSAQQPPAEGDFVDGDKTVLDGIPVFLDNVAAVIADTNAYDDDVYVKTRAEGFTYLVDSTATSGTYIENSASPTPVRLKVLPAPDGLYPLDAFSPDESDATAAWEAATAIGSVQLGPREYILSNAVTGVGAKVVRGISGATTLTAKAATSESVMLFSVSSKSNVIFEHLNINGNEDNITQDAFNNVVTIYNSTNIRFNYCKFYDTEGIAIIFSLGSWKLFECEFENCGTRNEDTADTADRRAAVSFTGSTYGEMAKCRFNDVGLDMISVATGSHYFKVTECTGLDNDAGGFYFSASNHGIIADCYVSNAATDTDGGNGFDISSCNDLAISNCGRICAARLG